MKKLLFSLALMLVGITGAWATVPTYTWDFSNTTTWTTAKVSTGSAVTYDCNGVVSTDGSYNRIGVTFNFATNVTIGSDTGAAGQVKQNNASKSVYGKYLWFMAGGSATSNNVTVTVASNQKVTFDLFASDSRIIYYTLNGGDAQTISSNKFEYDNTGTTDVTIVLWANNPLNGDYYSNNAIKKITLKDYNNAENYTATINAVATIENVKTTIKTQTYSNLTEEKDYTVSSWKVISYNGKYYEQENSSTMTDFSKTYTMGSADETREINYVLAEDIEYYAEGEDLNSGQSRTSTTSSGGKYTYYFSGQKSSLELSGGTYQVEYITRERTGSTGQGFWVYAEDGTTLLYEIAKANIKSNVYYTTNDFLVPAGEKIKFNGTGNSTSIDFILVRKVSDYEVVGNRDFTTGYWQKWNKTAVQINSGETGYYKIINHNKGNGETYQNWYLYAANTSSVNKTVLRADNAANYLEGYQIGTFGNSANYNKDNVNFATDLSDATVELYVTYNKPTLNVVAKTTKADGSALPDYLYTQTDYTDDALNLFVSVENSWLEVVNQGKAYSVTCNEAENGTVSAPTVAGVGEEVTLTVTPAENYILDALTVKDASENEVTVTDNKFTMPSSNVTVTATFKQNAYTATVTAKDAEGNVLGTYSATANIGEKASVYYPKYISKDGKIYVIAKNTSDPWYGVVLTEAGNVDKTYDESSATACGEFEAITPSTGAWGTAGAVANRYSNGVAKRLAPKSYVDTQIGAGIYNVTIGGRNERKNTPSLTLYTRAADGTLTLLATTPTWSDSETAEKTVEKVTIPSGCTLVVNNATDYTTDVALDYFTVTKTGNYVTPGYELVTNGSFDTDLTGWTTAGTRTNGTTTECNGFWYNNGIAEMWADNSATNYWWFNNDCYISQTINDLPAGYYTVSAKLVANGGNRATFSVTDDKNNVLVSDTQTRETLTNVSYLIKLAEDGSLTIKYVPQYKGSAWVAIDDVTLTVSTYVAPETLTITPADNCDGYVSFCNTDANYTAPEGTNIYKAADPEGNIVTLTYDKSINVIPAGQAVVLRAANGGSIELTKDGSYSGEFFSDNKFAISTGSTVEGYVMGYTATEGFGFYKYNAALAAGKVYIPGTISTAKLSIKTVEFNDPTAINNVNANVNANKVAEGKYIKNGKLVIVKNGRTYNAAGAQVK